MVRQTGTEEGVIEEHLARRNLFYRSNARRQKLIAANVDVAVLVVATEPAFSGELLARCIIAAQHQNMSCIVLLNKCDLKDKLPAARICLAGLALDKNVEILEIVASDREATARLLLPRLTGQVSLLAGASGMGKSTLINALVADGKATTGTISQALNSGRHTTTVARLYFLSPPQTRSASTDDTGGNTAPTTLADWQAGGAIIDSPGLQAFGLGHMDNAALEAAFPEFAPWLGHCRFRDCHHGQEPGCALTSAVATGGIPTARLALFRTLLAELPPLRSASIA
jgi:ribosome biogenesis GTPase